MPCNCCGGFGISDVPLGFGAAFQLRRFSPVKEKVITQALPSCCCCCPLNMDT